MSASKKTSGQVDWLCLCCYQGQRGLKGLPVSSQSDHSCEIITSHLFSGAVILQPVCLPSFPGRTRTQRRKGETSASLRLDYTVTDDMITRTVTLLWIFSGWMWRLCSQGKNCCCFLWWRMFETWLVWVVEVDGSELASFCSLVEWKHSVWRHHSLFESWRKTLFEDQWHVFVLMFIHKFSRFTFPFKKDFSFMPIDPENQSVYSAECSQAEGLSPRPSSPSVFGGDAAVSCKCQNLSSQCHLITFQQRRRIVQPCAGLLATVSVDVAPHHHWLPPLLPAI